MRKRVYFRNLNALRFFAATAVIFHHIEQYKFWAKLPNVWGNTVIVSLGHKAVSLFFVLSGFLISYLLLVEHQSKGDISIGNFYWRRALRIWPLYYLIVILCLFVVPAVFDLYSLGSSMFDDHYTLKVFFLFLVMPNVVRVFSPAVVGGNQLWSIGVEEQFYLVWPLLTRWFINHFLLFLFIFIAVKAVITIGLEYVNALPAVPALAGQLFQFWQLLQVEQMAVGAIGAWLLFTGQRCILDLVYTRWVWKTTLIALVALMIAPFDHWMLRYVEATVFIVFILNLSTSPRVKISLEHPVLNMLGNISYGIYMYHTLCITACLFVLQKIFPPAGSLLLFNLLLYTFSVGCTLVVAYFSYEYFEKFFLNWKERYFTVIKSGGVQVKDKTSGVTSLPASVSLSGSEGKE